MSPVLLVGVLLLTGFALGEVARRLRLPKVTGFILGGVLLNPDVLEIVPPDFTEHTSLVTNVALSFITFSVGGTLRFSRLRRLGKGILAITLCEGELAFVVTVGGILLVAPWLLAAESNWLTRYIPVALLMGCLAAPTDPSATLAIIHEYKARGSVSSTIMGVAALDDVLGIVNFSIAIALAQTLASSRGFGVSSAVLVPAIDILGALLLGAAFGLVFSGLTRLSQRETEGVLIVIALAMLTLCFGTATLLGLDELLATMTMGMIVANFNPLGEKVFRILERYTEELVFVLFFTISGMQLNFAVLAAHLPLVLAFVLFRSLGKVSGAMTGAWIARSPRKVRKYVAGGLIPQGGIVIGLALVMQQNRALSAIAEIVISVVIGATVIHEILGPIVSKATLQAAGEIHQAG